MKFLFAIGLIVLAILATSGLNRTVRGIGEKRHVADDRIFYIQKTLQLFIFIVVLLGLSLLFGMNYSQFGLVVSSVFAVIGIALFAQWSILSNVTASVIIFFFFPYRVGDKISIYEDKEKSLDGVIMEITLFHLLIKRDDGSVLSYPNSLVFQKPITIEPRTRRSKSKEKPKNTEETDKKNEE